MHNYALYIGIVVNVVKLPFKTKLQILTKLKNFNKLTAVYNTEYQTSMSIPTGQ